MKHLPDWLAGAQPSVPAWVKRLAHGDAPGRYRFAEQAFLPYDLDSSIAMYGIRRTINVPPDAHEAAAWIDYILDHQCADTGQLIDLRLETCIVPDDGDRASEGQVRAVRNMLTRNGLNAVVWMGGRPRYHLRHDQTFDGPDEMVAFMESRPWHEPWSAGSAAGAAIVFCHFNRLLGDASAEPVIQAGVDWLAAHQDPATGAWCDGSDNIALHQLVNGVFKIWIQVQPIGGLPIQHAESVIDLCLKALDESAALGREPDACSFFDVFFVLGSALQACDHRRDEVRGRAAAALADVEQFLQPDGAFSYYADGSRIEHAGLRLAPDVKQSEVIGTSLYVQAIALLCDLCGLADELGWRAKTGWGRGSV